MNNAKERFWSRVDKHASPTGCWIWTAGKLASGYGSFRTNNKAVVAHRYSYEQLVGPVAPGLQIDHICRNRTCVNPDHLEPVSQRTNLLRGISPPAVNARKSRCPKGHEFTSENTYRYPNGHRKCKQCRDSYKREYDRRRKADLLALLTGQRHGHRKDIA